MVCMRVGCAFDVDLANRSNQKARGEAKIWPSSMPLAVVFMGPSRIVVGESETD
jgi:hypothetical protein